MREIVKGEIIEKVKVLSSEMIIVQSDTGKIFFFFINSEEYFCPIFNYPSEYCLYDAPCRECPAARYFWHTEDGDIIPVRHMQSPC